ncbi:uncharacterized protein LOC144516256 [Sander vitreus]
MVSEVQGRWPALFCEAEIQADFYRLTNKNLIDNFSTAINQHTPGLLRLYRARRAAFPSEMDQLLKGLDEETNDITTHRQAAALKGLPLYLRDTRSCSGVVWILTQKRSRQRASLWGYLIQWRMIKVRLLQELQM